jgi:hypothetical protein
LVDSYLAFVAGRCRANTLRAVAHDLKTFFTVIDKAPVDVVAADVFAFVAEQRGGDRTVVRITDGESSLSARTIARRLSSISGFYSYLVARGDTAVPSNPVPRGLSTRRRQEELDAAVRISAPGSAAPQPDLAKTRRRRKRAVHVAGLADQRASNFGGPRRTSTKCVALGVWRSLSWCKHPNLKGVLHGTHPYRPVHDARRRRPSTRRAR